MNDITIMNAEIINCHNYRLAGFEVVLISMSGRQIKLCSVSVFVLWVLGFILLILLAR